MPTILTMTLSTVACVLVNHNLVTVNHNVYTSPQVIVTPIIQTVCCFLEVSHAPLPFSDIVLLP